MKLSEVKHVLKNSETIGFQLPNGTLVPTHFHVTEVGKINKQFIVARIVDGLTKISSLNKDMNVSMQARICVFIRS